MENYKLVLPAHLNQYGFLFGGDLLKWVDEYAWIAASLEYPGCKFVTIAMDEIEFRKSVREGTILKFVVKQVHKKVTSVQYEVDVLRSTSEKSASEPIFNTTVTFVRVNQAGDKVPI